MYKKNHHRQLFLAVIALSILFQGATWAAFTVEPFVLRLDISKGQSSGWMELAPAVNRPVPVEINVFKRIVNQDGSENFDSPSSDDLIVYPSEVLLFPGQKVRVQVSWAKKQAPRLDVAYALVMSEVALPVASEKVDGATAKVQTLARFRAVVAIETGKSGRLVVVSSKKIEGGKIEIVVENRGDGRVPLEGTYLIIRGKKYRKFTGSEGNSIMPGDRRVFELELPYLPAPNEISYGQGS